MKKIGIKTLFALLLLTISSNSYALKVGECLNLGMEPWYVYKKQKADQYLINTNSNKQGLLITIKKNTFNDTGKIIYFERGAIARLFKIVKGTDDAGFKVDVFIFKEDYTCVKQK